MKRVKLPLNAKAARAATQVLRAGSGGGPPSSNPADAPLRERWIQAYAAAGGDVEDESARRISLKSPVAPCPIKDIALQYLHADLTPVANACYVVQSHSGTVWYQGQLDANGCALIRDVPNEHASFIYYFYKDPQSYAPSVIPSQQPDAVAAESALDSIGDWIWGTLQGDFNLDPSKSQIVVNMLLGLIPIVDTTLDVRDVIAGIKHLVEYYQEEDKVQKSHPDFLWLNHETWLWLNVFIISIGIVPELGSVVKGILQTLLHYLKSATKSVAGLSAHQLRELWELIVKVLNAFGHGHANHFLSALPGKLEKLMAAAERHIRDTLDVIKFLLELVAAQVEGWVSRQVLSRKQIVVTLERLKRFHSALATIYLRLAEMKAKIGAWIRQQLSELIGGSHNFERAGTAGAHVNSRIQEVLPPPASVLPPLHANNLIKKHWNSWPEEVRRLYMQAQGAVTEGAVLVRKMAPEEAEAIRKFKQGEVELAKVFPPGKEGNKAFAIDQTYIFKKVERNAKEGYETVMKVPLDGGLREYLLQHMVPDKLPGKMPAELKDLPRFKLEQDGFTILIPKWLWSLFSRHIP